MKLRAISVLVTAAVLFGAVLAQGVGSLRTTSWDLPRTETDNTVVSAFFGALQAVQTSCPQSLQDSLAAERAYAACAKLGDYLSGELGRTMVEVEFLTTPGTWVSPWQEDPGFGVLRRLSFGGVEYYLAINEVAGLAYAIRFE